MGFPRISHPVFATVFFFLFASNALPQVADAGAVKSEEKARLRVEEKSGKDWLYTGLEMNYIVLNAADLLTSFYSIDRGAKEGNPVARLFIENKPVAVAVKGGLTVGVLAALRYVKGENKKAAYLALGMLNAMYAVVVTNNIRVAVSF